MYVITTITRSAWEDLLRKKDSGDHVVSRNVQRYSPVSAEYVPKSPDGLMPTLHRGYHGPGKCIALVPYALLYFLWRLSSDSALFQAPTASYHKPLKRLQALEASIKGRKQGPRYS